MTRSKLTNDQVVHLRELACAGYSNKTLAEMFHLSQNSISSIALGRLYQNVGGPIREFFKKRSDDLREKDFWEKVEIQDESSCWLWKGKVGANGYGVFKFHSRPIGAHQVALIFSRGEYPKHGRVIRHSCNVKLCCNPGHLRYGTDAENSMDTLIANAGPTQKLSVEDVLNIRKLYRSGLFTHRQIAEKYMVSTSTISSALRGETFSFVPGPVRKKDLIHAGKHYRKAA